MASATPPAFPHTDRWIAKPKATIPGILNVLTILTLINSAFGFIVALYGFALSPLAYRTAIDNQGRFDQLPEFTRYLLGNNHIERARLALENRVPILVAFASCITLTFLILYATQLKYMK
jgi:hypothetical protein